MNERLDWIDALRSIGILFVVLGHTGRLNLPLMDYVHPFHVPLFFFISGVFFKKYKALIPFLSFFKVRAFRLLVPYLSVSLFSYILWILAFRKLKDDSFSFIGSLIEIAAGRPGINVALWFFVCLFLVQIVFYFIAKLKSQQAILISILLSLLIGYGINLPEFPIRNLFWNIKLVPVAVSFYGIGYLCQSYFLSLSKLDHSKRAVLTIISFVLYVTFCNINENVEFYSGTYGNYLYFYIAALSGIFFWALVAQYIHSYEALGNAFAAVGRNTLVIFSAHLLVFPFFTGILLFVFKVPTEYLQRNDLVAFAYAISAIGLLVPISEVMKHRFPLLIGYPSK